MEKAIGPVEALEIALRKEISSIELYGNMGIKYPTINELCVFLVNEEHKHKKLIEQKIRELTKY